MTDDRPPVSDPGREREPRRLVFRQISPPTYEHTPFRLRQQSVHRRWT